MAPLVHPQQDAGNFTIPLSVFADDGKYISGLTASQLRVKDSRVSVQELTEDEAPHHIVLLIDVGADMALRWPGTLYDRWQFTRLAVDSFLSRMSTADTVSIYAFAEKQKALVTNTSDFRSASQASIHLPVPGSKEAKHEFGERSKFAAAFRQVLSSKEEAFHFGDAIVLFSCGEIGNEDAPYAFTQEGTVIDQERSDLHKLRAPLAAAGIRVLWFTATPLNPRFGPSGTRSLLLLEHKNVYDFYTDVGGLIFDSWDGDLQGEGVLLLPDDLPWEWTQPKTKIPAQKTTDEARMNRAAKKAYLSIRTMYKIKLQTTAGEKQPRKIEIEFVNAQGHPDKSTWLFYPRNLPSK